MKDWYSRVVFTVIAVALSVIALKMPTGAGAYALQQGCGSSPSDPCYVTNGEWPIDVRVK
jgi:hypothetical protein